MGSHQGRVEGEENLPRPTAHTPLDAPQDPTGLLVNQGTLLSLFLSHSPISMNWVRAVCPLLGTQIRVGLGNCCLLLLIHAGQILCWVEDNFFSSLGFSGGICLLQCLSQWSLSPILCWHWGNWGEGPDMDPFHDATHLRSDVSGYCQSYSG